MLQVFTCYCFPVIRVQGLINLIEQVKGGRVTLLDGKNQGQGHQRFLSPGQLLHVPHLRLVSGEGYLTEK